MSGYMSNVSTVKSSSLLVLNVLWEIIRLQILGTHQLSILSSQPVFLSTSSWSLVFSCWISTRTKFRLRCSFTICQLVNLNVDTVLNCFFGQISSNNSPHLKNLMFMYSPRFSHFLSFTTHRENRICMARLIDVTWPYKKRASRKKRKSLGHVSTGDFNHIQQALSPDNRNARNQEVLPSGKAKVYCRT